LNNNFTYAVAFALHDPIRDKVDLAIRNLTNAQVTVRMISGDLKETAVQTAIKAGIITEEQKNDPQVCFTGDELCVRVFGRPDAYKSYLKTNSKGIKYVDFREL
jgi:magnesium-transporting ATPase (P-type)